MATQIKPVRGKEFPRSFTKDVTDFGDWAQIEALFLELEKRGESIDSVEALEQWLLDQSELGAALDEEFSRRYIAMTCKTDDQAIEQSYLDFLEKVHPKGKPHWDKINRTYLGCKFRAELDTQRYEVYDRSTENEVKLFREENIPLSTEDSKLAQQYQKICGAMTVTFRGEEKTLQQMAIYLEETDRAVREEAWRLVVDRRMRDRDEMNDIFEKMITTRTKIAKNAGFDNFRDYQHRAYGRFDYGPEDCYAYHEAVEQLVVPIGNRMREERREQLGVETLRPWDQAVDPKGRPPLKPFESDQQLQEGCGKIFGAVDGELAEVFQTMRTEGLLDLDSRIGKAPGGYQSSLEEIRYPFIFMNAAGTDRDVYTLLHEGGHAFHAFEARQEPLLYYRHAPMEFCEVASMSMEMFAYDHLGAFYSDEDAARSRRHHTQQAIDLFAWIATIDAFQHWIYLNPDHSRKDREEKYLELEQRFSPGVDWSGLEQENRSHWQRQLHLFQVPFYYIEYGIAQLGALQLWLNHKNDPKGAVQAYRRGLALGGTRPLPELFEKAGAKFDFSVKTVGPIMKAIERDLAAT